MPLDPMRRAQYDGRIRSGPKLETGYWHLVSSGGYPP
jgi:hypothetical protein